MKSTPWGQSQHEAILAEGIVSHSAAGHGGIWLSAKRVSKLKEGIGEYKNWLGNMAWWEEDCDWAVPYVYFATDIQVHGTAYKFDANLEAAKNTLKNEHPEIYKKLVN